MTKFGIAGVKSRSPADWVARIRLHHMTDMEHEHHGLEAMMHWQDPVERLRTIRRRQHAHTLVDDNPASG